MLDPQAKALLERVAAAGRPAIHTLSAPDARQAYRDSRMPLQPPAPDVAAVEDQQAPGPHGPIGLRLYRAQKSRRDELLPTLVYFHGGGFTIGDLDTHDVLCRSLANAANCAVVSCRSNPRMRMSNPRFFDQRRMCCGISADPVPMSSIVISR